MQHEAAWEGAAEGRTSEGMDGPSLPPPFPRAAALRGIALLLCTTLQPQGRQSARKGAGEDGSSLRRPSSLARSSHVVQPLRFSLRCLLPSRNLLCPIWEFGGSQGTAWGLQAGKREVTWRWTARPLSRQEALRRVTDCNGSPRLSSLPCKHGHTHRPPKGRGRAGCYARHPLARLSETTRHCTFAKCSLTWAVLHKHLSSHGAVKKNAFLEVGKASLRRRSVRRVSRQTRLCGTFLRLVRRLLDHKIQRRPDRRRRETTGRRKPRRRQKPPPHRGICSALVSAPLPAPPSTFT